MASPKPIHFFTFLCFSINLFTLSLANETHHSQLSKNSNLPLLQAQQLIRQLNLNPSNSINTCSIQEEEQKLNQIGEQVMVENQFSFSSVLGDSLGDFGHHAGYYKLPHSKAARMFYFFFESRSNKADPVVIWLTGGPGCGSEVALFYENGPFHISDDLSLRLNNFGWDKASNIIYVDQPVGTGFSYTTDEGDIRHNEEQVSNDLYDFLQEFFKQHPQFVKNDFYITGESYAGHYIPAFASRVHQGNKAKEGIHINFKGFAIGNGLTNPGIQYAAYADYALDQNLITSSEHKSINKGLPACEQAIKACGVDGGEACYSAYVGCTNIFNEILSIAGDINYYDIRKKCVGQLCYNFTNMETFLTMKNVRQAIGVGNLDFVSCSSDVYQALILDWMRNLEVGIPSLLEDGIKVLIYAGEYDLICNWLGNSRWVHAMEWTGQKEFVAAPTTSFMVDGAEGGQMKNHGPLTFLKVHDAGHMVPMDQPKVSLQMLTRWIKGNLKDTQSSKE